jgi:hypothetical protein
MPCNMLCKMVVSVMANSPTMTPLPESPILTPQADSPELQPLPDSEDEEESQKNSDELKEAHALVASYCYAFDSDHEQLLRLVTSDIIFDWFGQQVQGLRVFYRFLRLQIPKTRHLSVNVECVEGSMVLQARVNGKLQFSRPGEHRKCRKAWQWERNFNLRLCYLPHSHLVQRIVYEKATNCKRALFG